MAQAFDGITSDVEHLTEQVRDLERRVSALESQPGKRPASQPESTIPSTQKAQSLVSAEMSSRAVPLIGKAVLGIAGAYLLRAITESGAVPKLPILIVAMLYAGLWLVWAVRAHATNYFASLAYAITAALILSPLLWESTVRFQLLSSSFTALVLVAFVVLAFGLSWQRRLEVIPWVAMLTAVVTAWALIIATHDIVPLTTALLAVALATEVDVCMGHRLTLRAVPAIAADIAVCLLIYLMTSPEGVPEGYDPASPVTISALCSALFAIYGGSIGIRSFGLRLPLTVFEITQAVVAFVLAAFGAMRASHASPGHGWAAHALGVVCMFLAVMCIWGALSRFADESHAGNRRICGTWAAALLLAGSFLLFSANLQVAFLCLAAVASVFMYARTRKLTLGMHVPFYLAAATAVSPLPTYAGSALAGTVPAAPDWGVWIVGGSSVLCYIIGSTVAEDHRSRRLLWVVPAMLVGFAAAALAVVAIVWLAPARVELSASRLSMVRTVVNCLLALAFGFLSRGKRVELGWAAYAALAFGTLKLLFEDLRFGNAASLVVSLLFYGLILILLPRLTRHELTVGNREEHVDNQFCQRTIDSTGDRGMS